MLEKPRNKEFTHSGCASNVEYAPEVPTKADSEVSLLTLKYEDGDLRGKAASAARPGRVFAERQIRKGEKAAGMYEGAEPPVFTAG